MKRIIFILCAIVALTSCSSIEKDIANEFKIYAKENKLKYFDKVIKVELKDSLYNHVYERKFDLIRSFAERECPESVEIIDVAIEEYKEKYLSEPLTINVYGVMVRFKNKDREIEQEYFAIDDGFNIRIQKDIYKNDIPDAFWKMNEFTEQCTTVIGLTKALIEMKNNKKDK